jgi:DNA anti-recombination protein RmuC
MVRHANQLRTHVSNLSAKSYWAELACTPEFVVMFLPGEAIYGAALQEDPTLIEEGVGKKVLIATPTTLIALLQAAYFGWHQERLAENARAISDQGRELHTRLATMFECCSPWRLARAIWRRARMRRIPGCRTVVELRSRRLHNHARASVAL